MPHQSHTSLEQVVRFAVLRGRMISNVVRQDEYTLDVVLPLGDVVLVYDTT